MLTHEEILETFRKELTEEGLLPDGDTIGTDDGTLLRFLRARKFNLRHAKKMWADCMQWRHTVDGVGIDELYRKIDPWDYPEREAVFKCWPMWFHKTDKKGRPLNIHYFSGLNMPLLYQSVSPERHWQTVLVNAESLTREVLPAASRAAGRRIDQTLVVVDLKGFGLSQFWQMKGLARDSFQISQDYFPETMGQLAIVNAPSSFAFIWSMIKPWLSKETAEKVDILGADYRDVLLALVDAENLPESLGGSCRCEAAGGCAMSCPGPWMEGRLWVGAQAGEELAATKDGETRAKGDEMVTVNNKEVEGEVEAEEKENKSDASSTTIQVKETPSSTGLDEKVAEQHSESELTNGNVEVPAIAAS